MKLFEQIIWTCIPLTIAWGSVALTNIATTRPMGQACSELNADNCTEFFACGDGRCYTIMGGSYRPMDIGKTCINDPDPNCYAKICSIFDYSSTTCTLLWQVRHNGTKSCAGD